MSGGARVECHLGDEELWFFKGVSFFGVIFYAIEAAEFGLAALRAL